MTLDTSRLRIVRRALDHPHAQQLVDEVQAEYVQIYGSKDEAPIDVAEFDHGAGAFLVGYLPGSPVSAGNAGAEDAEPGEAVATGAWRWVSTPDSLGGAAAGRAVELKRMFVRAPFRRAGLAAEVLRAVEEGAREAGATFAVLETGPLQQAAVELYRGAGYQPLSDFGHYRHMGAHAFVKRLR